ncbi:levansucrase [Micromonospora sp. NBC_01699]|uniref:levansucrase n=1 Tax=Micromonospora sp. NBC_01699 TaxID=2975984 RepID=UPI002E29A9E4|nr:levansucrase [Micromonospora sp. NBC_01699]
MTTAPQAYLHSLSERLTADGCSVTREDWGGMPVLVGRRSDFRLQWLATKLHLITIAADVSSVDAGSIAAFTSHAMEYAKRGVTRGAQVGVAAFPTLISDRVDPSASQWAGRRQRNQFACMGRPVVVDTARGTATAFRGTSPLGLVYSAHLRRKLGLYFPPTPLG